MRNALNAGAVLCCLIGLLFAYLFSLEIVKLWPQIPHGPGDVLVSLAFYWLMPAYTLLAFAPVTIIIKSRRTKKSLWRLTLLTGAESIVILAFLAMLLTKVYPSS